MEKMKIVLVHDDSDVRDLISRLLKQEKHTVKTCSHGREGLELMKTELPDVVITDYKMQEMNGIEVLKTIKSLHSETYVIILTGFANTINAIDAVNQGAYAFLCKPLNIESLLEAVSKIEKELNSTEEQEAALIRLCLEYRELEKYLNPRNRS